MNYWRRCQFLSMTSSNAYRRDVPRACMNLSKLELLRLAGSLKRFADAEMTSGLAQNHLLLLQQKAGELYDRIPESGGWIDFDNRELWVTVHALIQGRQYRDELLGRFREAGGPIGRLDPATLSLGHRGIGWDDTRQEAVERDGHACTRCGKEHSRLHVHHIVPYRVHNTSEGTNRPNNLETLCPA